MHPKRLVLWILWFAILSGFCTIYVFLGQPQKNVPAAAGDLLFRFLPFVPLTIAVALRFLAIPRLTSLIKVLPVFVAGLALAESAGILAIFLLSGDDARLYFAATLFVLLTYAPVFASRLDPDRAG